MSPRRETARVAVGEFCATALCVLVAFFSGLARAELGIESIAGALVGSAALGLGYALVVATFGSLSKAQAHPWISLLAAVGGQGWRQTAVRVAAQVAGAATASSLALLAPSLVGSAQSHPLADGVGAFGFVLVAIGVARRRDARVPVAVGAFATASFWMTGRVTVGNPLVAMAIGAVAYPRQSAGGAVQVIGATAAGALLGAALGWFLFPDVRKALGLVVYTPRPGGREGVRP